MHRYICFKSLFSDTKATIMGLTMNYFKHSVATCCLEIFFLFANMLFRQIERLGIDPPLYRPCNIPEYF